MKLCITSQADSLDAEVDMRFGRCQYFLLIDSDTLEFEAIKNPNISSGGGAGVKAGQLMVDRGVEVVITGNVGPNAFEVLRAAQIEIIVGVSGRVREVIERYKRGEFNSAQGPNVNSKFGA